MKSHGFRYFVILETDTPIDGPKLHERMKEVIAKAIGQELKNFKVSGEPVVREGHYQEITEPVP